MRRTRSIWLYTTSAAALIVAAIAMLFELRAPDPASADPRPVVPRSRAGAEIARLAERHDLNLLFILIDTLRADRVHLYGNRRETSPTLDYLALNGIWFREHLSQSSWTKWTPSSRQASARTCDASSPSSPSTAPAIPCSMWPLARRTRRLPNAYTQMRSLVRKR